MFFQSNIVEPTRIDTILASEDPRLTDILDEDDVIQQCVGQNIKLLDFLCQDKVFGEVMDFILTDPDPEQDVTVQYKYPSRACEVLTCEIPELTAKLSESEQYIIRIFEFIDFRKHEITSLQASFCVKLIQHLFKMKTKMLFDFMEKRASDTVEIFASSLHLPCLVDLLLLFASPIEDVDSGLPTSTGFLTPLVDAGLPSVLIKALSPENTSDRSRDAAVNAAQFSCEIIRCGPSPLSDALLSEDMINSLFSVMFLEDKEAQVPEFVLFHGFGIINTILTQDHQAFERSEYKAASSAVSGTAIDDFDNIDAVDVNHHNSANNFGASSSIPQHAPLSNTNTIADSSSQQRHLPDHVTRVISRLLNHMSRIRALIDNAPPQYALSRLCLSSTVNTEDAVVAIPPLGRLRLRIVETIQLLIEQRDAKIDAALTEREILPSVFQVFLRYKWNSLLHNSVERISSTILSSPGADRPLLKQLICNCNLVRVLLDSFETKDKQGNRGPGYSGQILLMANHLHNAFMFQASEEMSSVVPPDQLADWKKFAEGPLLKINERNRPDRLSNVSSTMSTAAASSTIMMMMAGARKSSTLTMPSQRIRVGAGRSAKTGTSGDDDDDDDDDDMDDNDHHGDSEQFSIDSVLRQMQSEYQRQDLSAKPLQSFNHALAALELDPQKTVMSNLPPMPRVPIQVVPPDQRKRHDSSDSDDDVNDNETAFESACSQRIVVPRAPKAKPQTLSDESDDDDLWRDDELQQGSFEAAKHPTNRPVFLREDAQGNVAEIRESEWNPFTSITPDQASTSPGIADAVAHGSSSDSSRASSDDDEETGNDWSKHTSNAFADFSTAATSGGHSDWPGISTSTSGTTGSEDWPGSTPGETFDAKFTDLFPSEQPPSTDSLVVDPFKVEPPAPPQQPQQPPPSTSQPTIGKIPPAIPPRAKSPSPMPTTTTTATTTVDTQKSS